MKQRGNFRTDVFALFLFIIVFCEIYCQILGKCCKMKRKYQAERPVRRNGRNEITGLVCTENVLKESMKMRLDRLNSIEQYILQEGTVTWESMAAHFGVSVNTIRRDIKELIARGTIRKVYGGVSSVNANAPVAIQERQVRNIEDKKKIGRLAAEFVQPGQTIFLDSGTTTPCLVPHLSGMENVTIVTHSLPVLNEASHYPSLQVISLGGFYNATTGSYGGISTLNYLSRIAADTVFIAATGVSLEHGLSHKAFFEAETKRKITECGKKIILMADHTKFGNSSAITFMDFDRLDGIVTDVRPAQEFLDAAANAGIIVVWDDGPDGRQL